MGDQLTGVIVVLLTRPERAVPEHPGDQRDLLRRLFGCRGERAIAEHVRTVLHLVGRNENLDRQPLRVT